MVLDILVTDLSHNQLHGLLPASMKNLLSLFFLDLSYNHFSPQRIPPYLLQLPFLSCLILSGNNFRGAIPDAFPIFNQFQSLYLDHNQLEHLLPPSMQNLQSLNFLDLSYNQFAPQEIPSYLLLLPLLGSLELSSNNFTGTSSFSGSYDIENNYTIPARMLQYVNLASNKLTSIFGGTTFPTLPNLEALDLRDNLLQGPFPPFMKDVVPELLILNMNNNQLQGPIPSFISYTKNVQVLDLGLNKLSGSIPQWVGSLEELRVLDLAGNVLTGSIPPSLGLVKAMQVYDTSFLVNEQISYTDVTAVYLSFPIVIAISMKGQKRTFSNVELLSVLDLSNNQLSGSIPPELGKLKGLQSLNLAGNRLDGEIPGALGNLTNIESMDLSRNMLSGLIPPTFEALQSLAFVNFSVNHLSGSIPSSPLWFDTFGTSSFLHNDGLCTTSLKSLAQLPVCGPNNRSGIQLSYDSPMGDGTFLEEDMEWSGFVVGYVWGLVLGSLTMALARRPS